MNTKKQSIEQTPKARVQMDDDAERAKAFWDDNKYYIIGAIVLSLLLIFGFEYYKTYTSQKSMAASDLYQQLLEVEEYDKAQQIANTLESGYSGSEYEALGQLVTAKLAVESDNLAETEQHFRSVIDQHGNTGLGQIARLRLAEVLLAQQKYDDVITLLSGESPEAFNAQYNNLLGDAHAAKGNAEAAMDAYRQSIAAYNQRIERYSSSLQFGGIAQQLQLILSDIESKLLALESASK